MTNVGNTLYIRATRTTNEINQNCSLPFSSSIGDFFLALILRRQYTIANSIIETAIGVTMAMIVSDEIRLFPA